MAKGQAISTKPSPKQKGPFTKLTVGSLLLAILAAVAFYLDSVKHRWYEFDPPTLHAIALEALAASPNSTEGVMSHIFASLHSTYPQDSSRRVGINPNDPMKHPEEWFFNNAGGAMGSMYVLHASITEYLIFFGTPLGTEGHSGLHPADDYFHILYGEQWAFEPGALEKEVYRPGDVHLMPRGVKKQYKVHEGCWAMEYARGWPPLMLFFGFADGFTSTLDFPTLWKMSVITAREMARNLFIGKI